MGAEDEGGAECGFPVSGFALGAVQRGACSAGLAVAGAQVIPPGEQFSLEHGLLLGALLGVLGVCLPLGVTACPVGGALACPVLLPSAVLPAGLCDLAFGLPLDGGVGWGGGAVAQADVEVIRAAWDLGILGYFSGDFLLL